MKEYDHLLADDPQWAERAKAFVAKTRDVHELLGEHEPQAERHPLPMTVAYHDACHLAHAQGVRSQPRELLRGIPGLELVEPADWEICCGSAGIYNLRQARARRRARQAQGREPGRDRRRGDRRRQPGLLDPDLGPPRAADPDLPPDDPARPLDQRRNAHELARSRPRPGRTRRRHPLRRRAGLPRRAARALQPAPARAAAGAQGARRAERLPGGDQGDPRGRLAASPPPRPDYEDRRVEITGPTDRKLVINALNSGAKGFMADFEDANSPTWANQVEGHVNLIDAIEGTITYDSSEGKHYELDDEVATLLVRPRGWHLPEKHLRGRRRDRRGRVHGLRPVLLPQRPAAARHGQGAVPLPAQDGAPPRGAAVERRLRLRPGRARRPAGHDPRDRADRDAPGRVPDGRDPLRAARALLRPQRRPLGLHLLDDQVLPRPARSSCSRTAPT